MSQISPGGRVNGSENIVRILPLREEDAQAAADLEKENYSLPWTRSAFLDALGRGYYRFLKAEEGERILGLCGYLRSFETAQITNVTVRRDCRRRGIARRMLLKLMETGRREGATRFTLEVRRSNEAAIALYESLGFRTEGVRKGYYESPREDALILSTAEPAAEERMR